MINSGLFSSASDSWDTPQALFDRLHAKYQFGLDVCATAENSKCGYFFDKDDDGLKQNWAEFIQLHISGNCWMNPPYGREIGKWVKKAYEESLNGVAVVCLLPARTDTRWFQDYCIPFGKIEFIRGRLKFGGSKNSAPFPSCIVVFGE